MEARRVSGVSLRITYRGQLAAPPCAPPRPEHYRPFTLSPGGGGSDAQGKGPQSHWPFLVGLLDAQSLNEYLCSCDSLAGPQDTGSDYPQSKEVVLFIKTQCSHCPPVVRL